MRVTNSGGSGVRVVKKWSITSTLLPNRNYSPISPDLTTRATYELVVKVHVTALMRKERKGGAWVRCFITGNGVWWCLNQHFKSARKKQPHRPDDIGNRDLGVCPVEDVVIRGVTGVGPVVGHCLPRATQKGDNDIRRITIWAEKKKQSQAPTPPTPVDGDTQTDTSSVFAEFQNPCSEYPRSHSPAIKRDRINNSEQSHAFVTVCGR